MTDPRLAWNFGEASGNVIDYTGNGYDFALTGNTVRTAAGGGYTYGGTRPNTKGLTQTAASIQVGPALTGLETVGRTWMAWLKFNSHATCWALEFHRTAEDTGVWGLLNLSSTPRFRAKNSSNTAFESNSITPDLGNYHHLCLTHDGSNLRYYRDGTLISTTAMAFPVWGANTFRVLDNSGSSITISEVRMFNAALDVTEINTWMNTPVDAGATNLVIQDASIGVASDNLTISQIIDLAIQKAFLATKSTTPNFSQIHNITIHKAFLQTAADIVNFAAESGGPVSVSDIQREKLLTLTGLSIGTINDLFHAYYGGLSGLVPSAAFSVTDHQRVYWEVQTGLTNVSMADLEKAFYDAQLVPSGSLADREYVYWNGL